MRQSFRISGFVFGLSIALAFIVSSCMEDRPIDSFYVVGDQQQGTDSSYEELDAGIEVSSEGMACRFAGEPTWESPINSIMQNNCTSCHVETSGYNNIQAWVQSGALKTYVEMGAAHYLSDSTEQASCLRWLEIGAPEKNCP